MAGWVFREELDVSWEHCGRSAYWADNAVVCSKCQETMPERVVCPNGEGDPFSCEPFCVLCEGSGEVSNV